MKAFQIPKISLWHLPLVLFGLTMMAPLAFMLTTALSAPGAAMRSTENLWEMIFPQTWQWSNFVEVWRTVPFLRYYCNSLGIALVVTVGQVFTSACAAYAFSRLTWPGRDKLFLAYLATMMVPGAVTMVPNFILMKSLPEWLGVVLPFIDWDSMRYLGYGDNAPMVGRLIGLDSYFALTVPMMFSAYGTFLLRQFLLSIPRELEEAAMIDGCSYWTIFSRIIMPLSLPGLATLTIFTFMGIWGSFLWPLVITNMDDLWTLPLGLQAFQGQYGTEWHLMMAAALLMILPVMLIFLFGQRFFISGLTVGGVKG
jgi:multiple sugar transport system permease protein